MINYILTALLVIALALQLFDVPMKQKAVNILLIVVLLIMVVNSAGWLVR